MTDRKGVEKIRTWGLGIWFIATGRKLISSSAVRIR